MSFYTPLRISTVKPLKEVTFDLYIYFKGQYLCYLSKGDKLTPEKHGKLKSQKIAKFYITESDEFNYQRFLDNTLAESLDSGELNADEKVSVVQDAATDALERMQKDPGSEVAFKMTEVAAKGLIKIIKTDPDVLKKIFGKKAEKNEEIIKHSLNVCALSLKLAERLGCNEQELNDLGTAALIHDVGLSRFEGEEVKLFYKNSRELNHEEKNAYYSHVRNVEPILHGKNYVNKVVYELVLNHEEVLSGKGPNKKKKLTKLEEILSLVNNYDKRSLVSGQQPEQVMKEMIIDELGNYSLPFLKEFQKVLQEEGI